MKANKLTISRIILSVFIIILLIFPFESAGVFFPNLFINELIVINIKYLIAAFFFLSACIMDLIDTKKHSNILENNNDLLLRSVADKMLLDAVLIILAAYGFINPIIPVVVIVRDSIVNSIKMIVSINGKKVNGNKLGKVKTVLLMFGVFLTLIYNLPFELLNLRVSDITLLIATVISIISCIQYYNDNKKYFLKK